jgi:hypothetical protein
MIGQLLQFSEKLSFVGEIKSMVECIPFKLNPFAFQYIYFKRMLSCVIRCTDRVDSNSKRLRPLYIHFMVPRIFWSQNKADFPHIITMILSIRFQILNITYKYF